MRGLYDLARALIFALLASTAALLAICLGRREEMESLIDRWPNLRIDQTKKVIRQLDNVRLRDNFILSGHKISVIRIGDVRLDVTIDEERIVNINYLQTVQVVRYANGREFILADGHKCCKI